jgi:hypothetical protein
MLPGRMGVLETLRLLFGFRAPVGRKAYAISGFALMALKYGGDWTLTRAAAEHAIAPTFYLNPIFSLRLHSLGRYPDWLPVAMVLWAAPFVWIGVSMTARRAADAGQSVLVGLAFFVPIVNYLIMILLCVAPPWGLPQRNRARLRAAAPSLRAALAGVAAAAVLGLIGTLLAVRGAGRYDSSLFLGLPFLLGFVAGLVYNRRERRSARATLGVAALAMTTLGGLLLLFALEGVICLLMAAVLAYPLALLGALLGRGMAMSSPAFPATMMLSAWPIFALVPPWQSEEPPVREVISAIEIPAPPEVVWHQVIGFSELPPPDEWVLRTGIAYPLRARIEGEGVGAIRHCEFTTGPFIEPITRWEPGRRLSFDVVSQPPSMKEWSPYEIVHAPHVIGSMRSLRGEFRLVRLPGGRTRLEGSTWYRLTLAPNAYWSWFADRIVHAIHERVLRHVRVESMRAARAQSEARNP